MCEERVFCPPSRTWQKALCSQFKITHSDTKDLYQPGEKHLGLPTSFHKIKGDGNCLFRALAYSISGNEENHGLFRSLIVSHSREIELNLVNNDTQNQYLERTKMSENETWATEVEIFAASSLFKCRIFLYAKHGNTNDWFLYEPLDIRKDQRLSYSKESIYLYHRDENHCDIVKDVDVQTEDSSTPTQESIVQDNSFDTQNSTCDAEQKETITEINNKETNVHCEPGKQRNSYIENDASTSGHVLKRDSAERSTTNVGEEPTCDPEQDSNVVNVRSAGEYGPEENFVDRSSTSRGEDPTCDPEQNSNVENVWSAGEDGSEEDSVTRSSTIRGEDPTCDPEQDSNVENVRSAGEDGSEDDSVDRSSTIRGEDPTCDTKQDTNVAEDVSSDDSMDMSSTNMKESDLRHLREEDIMLAATLVIDVKEGRNIKFKKDPKSIRSYILYHKLCLRILHYICIIVNLALALFEKPAVPGLEISPWIPMMFEAACLIYFTFRLILYASFSNRIKFWWKLRNFLIAAVIVVTIWDMTYFFSFHKEGTPRPIRWTRVLRPIFLVNFPEGIHIRRALRNIRWSLLEIVLVIVPLLLSVIVFGFLAFKLFMTRDLVYPNGKPYFKNFWESIWDLYVLVTTANNPDVMMPAYDSNNWFALFFISYLVICWFLFMNIVLAVVYNSYKKSMENVTNTAKYQKKKKLGKAFDILKVQKGDRPKVSNTVWYSLLKHVDSKLSDDEIYTLTVLLRDDNRRICKPGFLKLVDQLQSRRKRVKDRQTSQQESLPENCKSKISEFVKQQIKRKAFRYFFDFMIFVNVWFISFDVVEAEWVFLGIFLLEIILQVYTFGPKAFFKVNSNKFDVLVISGATVSSFVALAISEDGFGELYEVVLVLRVLRLFKIFERIKRFKVILKTINYIWASLITYGGVIVVFYYIFAIIGMEFFQNRIRYYGYNNQTSNPFCGDTKLNGTDFYMLHYCNNNFNDLLHSLVLLVELTVVNQWHVLASGFATVTNKAALLYFFCFHVCCVIIIQNIFTAFILDAFVKEYELQKHGQEETKVRILRYDVGQVRKRVHQSHESSELVTNEVPSNEDDADTASDTESIRQIGFNIKRPHREMDMMLSDDREGLPYMDLENETLL